MVSKIDLGILAIAGLSAFLIIRGAGQKLDELGNPFSGVQLPSLPSLPSFSLPSIPSIFGDSQTSNPLPPDVPNTGLLPQEDILNCRCGSQIIQDIQGDVQQVCLPCQNESSIVGPIQPINPDRPTSLSDFIQPSFNPDVVGPVQSEFDNQQFAGGGESFIGGVVRETPINFNSLSEIIDRFKVSASQASNIRAEQTESFGDFDFGTNTGRGIGSVFARPDINTELESGNVSNPEFAGLTPTEIVKRLLGGNINNF